MTIMMIMIIVMMMMLQVWSSAISATLASKFLVTGGLLVLPGAQPATGATPGMMGYGMAKVGDSDIMMMMVMMMLMMLPGCGAPVGG